VKTPLSTLRLTNRIFCEADGNPEAACLQIRPVKVNCVLLLTDWLFSHWPTAQYIRASESKAASWL
jgi:hypothetical protein